MSIKTIIIAILVGSAFDVPCATVAFNIDRVENVLEVAEGKFALADHDGLWALIQRSNVLARQRVDVHALSAYCRSVRHLLSLGSGKIAVFCDDNLVLGTIELDRLSVRKVFPLDLRKWRISDVIVRGKTDEMLIIGGQLMPSNGTDAPNVYTEKGENGEIWIVRPSILKVSGTTGLVNMVLLDIPFGMVESLDVKQGGKVVSAVGGLFIESDEDLSASRDIGEFGCSEAEWRGQARGVLIQADKRRVLTFCEFGLMSLEWSSDLISKWRDEKFTAGVEFSRNADSSDVIWVTHAGEWGKVELDGRISRLGKISDCDHILYVSQRTVLYRDVDAVLRIRRLTK